MGVVDVGQKNGWKVGLVQAFVGKVEMKAVEVGQEEEEVGGRAAQ